MGFPRQEYWSGLPFPPSGDLPDPGIKTRASALAGGFFITRAAQGARSSPDWYAIHSKLDKLGILKSFQTFFFISLSLTLFFRVSDLLIFFFGCAGSLLLHAGFL